ncbi:DUF6303 family protein [Streptomyces chartreusis]
MLIRALMSQHQGVGNWHLYVCTTPGVVADWPRHDWPVSHRSIPTVGERDKALKKLGYQRTAELWEWQEYESDSGRVKLFASIEVSPE